MANGRPQTRVQSASFNSGATAGFSLGALLARLQGDGLGARTARGSLWLGGAGAIENIARLGRNMLLVRLLAPDAFGIMGILLATNAAFESFSEVGIRQAVVHSPESGRHEYLNGVWWFSIARGLLLYTLAYLLAPWLARFYGKPELLLLLRIVGLGIIMHAVISPSIFLALKRMQYGRWTLVFHGAAIGGVLATVVMAVWIRNVWVLVSGFLGEALLLTALSYGACPFRPGVSFDRRCFQALLKYAGGMVGIPVLMFVFLRAEIFVVGKLCSVEQLGLYAMILALANIPVSAISKLLPQLAMPAFTEMQGEPERINQCLITLTRVISFLGFPMLVFAFAFGRPTLEVVYGSRYAALSLPFAVVMASSLLRVFAVPIANVYFALGRPALHRCFTFIRTAMLCILIFPAVRRFGVLGASASVLAASLLASLYHMYALRRLTGLRVRSYYAAWAEGVVLSVVVLLVWAVGNHFNVTRSLTLMTVGVLGILASYALAVLRFLRRD